VEPAVTAADEHPKMVAALAMIGRTGAVGSRIRYSDDEQPVVWLVVGEWPGGRHEVAAGMTPLRAALRLCEQVIDGGVCQHCHRPAGFEPDSITSMPLGSAVCWYQYDPELRTYRRSCEHPPGETTTGRAARGG
jgi:hypothetical protein